MTGVPIEVRVNRSPWRIAFWAVLLTALTALFAASAVGLVRLGLARELSFCVACVFLWSSLKAYMEILRLKEPIAVLRQIGIYVPDYSATVIPWDKVVDVKREYDGDNDVIGLRFSLEPEFERELQRKGDRRRVRDGISGGFVISTDDADDDVLAAYCYAMMHQEEALNV